MISRSISSPTFPAARRSGCAPIYRAQRQWREASEQIELYYGDCRRLQPLDAAEKGDIIRAVVGYALAGRRHRRRFRENETADVRRGRPPGVRHSQQAGRRQQRAEFALIARMAASVDTLDGFIREMKTRFPDATARAPLPDPVTTGALSETGREAAKADPVAALPAIVGVRRVGAAR